MKTFLMVIVSGMLLVSCSSAQEEQLLGEWVDVEKESEHFTIEQNRDSLFIITLEMRELHLQKKKDQYLVTFQNESLPLRYDKTTSLLYIQDVAFVRFSKSKKQQLVGKYYLYNESEKKHDSENHVELISTDTKSVFVKFSDESIGVGSKLNYSKDEGFRHTLYRGRFNTVTQRVTSTKIDGKDCVVFDSDHRDYTKTLKFCKE